VIKGKQRESETLRQQATNNSKEQLANSPDLKNELLNAIIGALDENNTMSTERWIRRRYRADWRIFYWTMLGCTSRCERLPVGSECLVMSICRLCGKDGELIDSHIIPKAFHRDLKVTQLERR